MAEAFVPLSFAPGEAYQFDMRAATTRFVDMPRGGVPS